MYDPRLPNDRLLLGMKGTMSEMELSLLRQRSLEALRQKARRGELFFSVAVGYVKVRRDRIAKDPDRRVQEAIALVFRKFAEFQSMRQVHLWLRQEEILLPASVWNDEGRQIVWKLPVYNSVRAILTTRDGKLKGFGVRVLPSGRIRFFVHCQHRGERIWKIVGDADSMTVAEARSRAGAILTAIRRGEDAPRDPRETLFEAVAETVFQRYQRVWKAGTLNVNRGYLRQQILPHFAGRPVADIDRREVRNWFASLRATPAAADRSMPVLSVIMREAEAMGLRPEGSNPCRGIRRYRRKGRERFLSNDEIRRLAATLSAHAGRQPLQVAAIRLLLLTGCRKSEILTLRWSDYREGRLFLRDSKTGPRTVWLSRPARDVFDGLERIDRWVFPAPRTGGPQGRGWLDHFWSGIRAEADLRDVRLHDLRHTHASIALRQGETVLAIARLLGHRNAETTLKYTHPADAMVMDAAETVGAVLER